MDFSVFLSLSIFPQFSLHTSAVMPSQKLRNVFSAEHITSNTFHLLSLSLKNWSRAAVSIDQWAVSTVKSGRLESVKTNDLYRKDGNYECRSFKISTWKKTSLQQQPTRETMFTKGENTCRNGRPQSSQKCKWKWLL